MPLGDDNDFRTSRWQVARRFPGLMERGGDGSAMIPSFNRPSGYSDLVMPPIGIPGIPGTTITLPGISITGGPEGGGFVFPPISFPPITFPTIPVGGTGGAGTTITVNTDNDGTGNTASYSDVSTINFIGSNLTSVTQPTKGTVDVDYSAGGGGGGSTLQYFKIKTATKVAGVARWTYTGNEFVNGVEATSGAGFNVTMYNLLEIDNTGTSAYGYVVGGANGDTITGTSFTVKSVPVGTMVQVHYNDEPPPGTTRYWFSAPNRIDGTC